MITIHDGDDYDVDDDNAADGSQAQKANKLKKNECLMQVMCAPSKIHTLCPFVIYS